ncbi:sensor histidine kinase [Verrucomicrobium sp. BvORR106]|uniref:sensor histidine kinase n=1 Tax=Verrucomicrobium sp. BvORR106 TaxID=1403819 RepID=UPI0009E07FA6|nr:sensor histidine kinase [Verrucomicrobium sp. BvORR106]
MQKTFITLCGVAAVLAGVLALATPTRIQAGEQFLVRSWQSEDGLPSNSVRAVVQSADGYLWVATAEGVVRFDGVRFTTFKEESSAQLAKQPPRELYALENGEVWISTMRGGLLRWDGRRLVEAWAGTVAGARGVQPVTQVWSDEAGGAYIESGDKIYHAERHQPPRLLKEDRYVEARAKTKFVPWQRCIMAPPGAPLDLIDGRGRRWMRTLEGHLAVSDPSQDGPLEVLTELSEGVLVMALLEDRESNVWVATNGNGLVQVRVKRVNVMDVSNGLTNRNILALMEDSVGVLWAANKSGGVDRIHGGWVNAFPLGERDASRIVMAIAEDPTGTLWLGKENGSLYYHDGTSFQELVRKTPLARRLRAMTFDKDSRLWLAGGDGVSLWDRGTLTQFSEAQGLPQQEVTSLVMDESGTLWAGTDSSTIYQHGDGRFKLTATLGATQVSAMLPDEEAGALWATTLGSGLFLRKKDGTVTGFSIAQGLPDDRLTCVLDDKMGHLWMGSLTGIIRVPKKDLLQYTPGSSSSISWLQFDRSDGLISRECTGGFQPAGWRGQDGTLWFPTVQGVASVRPQNLEFNRVKPWVAIEEARAGSEWAEPGATELKAGPGRSRIELHYTALSFSAPEKVKFRTRLEGLETEWREAGAQRMVAYEAVPPGDYVFHVMASNNDGVWSATATSLQIHITPHFWETLWFRVSFITFLVVCASAGSAMAVRSRLRNRMLQLEAQTSRQKERERIAQDLHDDLGASLTEISLLAELAAEETGPEARRETAPIIASKARHLVGTLDEIVWAVNPRHDTLASFVDYLTASAAELLDVGGVALRLEIPDDIPNTALDAEQRHELFLAVREALNNTVKHASATEVKLRLQVRLDVLTIVVTDNGKGISGDQSRLSEGLHNMQRRLSRIGGTCSIESDSSGTCITFSLPLRRNT